MINIKRVPEVLHMGKHDWAVVDRNGYFMWRSIIKSDALIRLDRARLEK